MILKHQTLQWICLLLTFFQKTASQQCSINLKKKTHEENQPLFLQPDSKNPTYLYPEVADGPELVIKSGETINIFCPGKINIPSHNNAKKNVTASKINIPIECIENDKFSSKGTTINFSDISCLSYNPVLKALNQKCGTGNRYKIGFVVEDGSFLETIDLCHDPNTANTLWSHSIIPSINQATVRYTGEKNKAFKTGSLYENMAMSKENPYSLDFAFNNLVMTFNSLTTASKYASPKPGDRKFLAIGHLIANADKVYKSEQMSTYFYANAAPMWQQINARPGNWFFVEEYVRFLAVNKKRDLEVWVGGLGVLELEGEPIYLYNKLNEQTGKIDHKIPVPKNLYKCVVDKSKKEAMCFVVVNNPYATQKEISSSNDYIVCKQYKLCDLLTDSFNDITRGFAYCCTLKDFYKNNHNTLALDDVKPFLGYEPMELLNFDKNNPRIIKVDASQAPKRKAVRVRKNKPRIQSKL